MSKNILREWEDSFVELVLEIANAFLFIVFMFIWFYGMFNFLIKRSGKRFFIIWTSLGLKLFCFKVLFYCLILLVLYLFIKYYTGF